MSVEFPCNDTPFWSRHNPMAEYAALVITLVVVECIVLLLIWKEKRNERTRVH